MSDVLILFSPHFALFELHKYRKLICSKSNITNDEFNKRLLQLKEKVTFLKRDTYLTRTITSPDKDDVDFLALATKLVIPLWTNDKKLQEQEDVEIITTTRLLERLKSL